MAFSPAELDSLGEVNKVEPYHETEGYHGDQGFGYTHHAHEAIHAENRIGRYKDADTDNNAGADHCKSVECKQHFMQVMGGNTPLSAYQNRLSSQLSRNQMRFLKDLDDDLEENVENSLDKEGAMDVITDLAEYADEYGEPAAEDLYEDSLKDSDGNTILTKADHIAHENENLECTLKQSVQGNIDGKPLDYSNDTAPVAQTTETETATPTTEVEALAPVSTPAPAGM